MSKPHEITNATIAQIAGSILPFCMQTSDTVQDGVEEAVDIALDIAAEVRRRADENAETASAGGCETCQHAGPTYKAQDPRWGRYCEILSQVPLTDRHGRPFSCSHWQAKRGTV